MYKALLTWIGAGSQSSNSVECLTQAKTGVLISLGGFSNDARHTEQNDANLILIDAERFVEMFLNSYDQLGADMRHKHPLRTVHVIAG